MSRATRVLRAFAWLRWRVLVNSFERQGARDVVERFSVALDQITPTLVLLLMVPSAVILAAAGIYAGWLLARGETEVITLDLLRFVLLVGCGFAVIGPVMLPSGDRTNTVRLLLLPIPRGLLYAAQGMSIVADPWMLLVIAAVAAIPVGLAAGGAVWAAVLVGFAGAALIVVLVGIALLVSGLVQLALRDRRRGEILTLLFIVILPMLGMVSGLMPHGQDRPGRRSIEDNSRIWAAVERTASVAIPSEVFITATRRAAAGNASAPSVLTLAGAAAALHGLAFAVFTRLLASPASVTASRTTTRWGARIPGVSPGTSAVALAQLKLGLRTPRGRSIIISPIAFFLIFAVVMARSPTGASFTFLRLESGLSLAAFTSVLALLSVVPLAMNQFAIDRAGLTLMLLAPIDTRALLAGKAIGNALIAAIPCGFCVLAAAVFFPLGDPALWLSLPLTLVATYILVSPVAATLSAIFPKAVDLNSMGRSNAHGTAGFLGTLTILAAGTPSLAIVMLATKVLDRPALAPLLLVAWTAVCAGISVVLFSAVASLFDRRRENLAKVA